MNKSFFMLFASLLGLGSGVHAALPLEDPVNSRMCVIGGGISAAMESYYAHQDALKKGKKICVTVYEKGGSFIASPGEELSANTACNIVGSLTTDEILSIVPRGSELVEKLSILFSEPGGIRVDDVPGANDSEAALRFKQSVAFYASDPNHNDRTMSLLMLGKKSMGLWQEIYEEGDEELKAIFRASNFHPCHEPSKIDKKMLHDGYRIDLLYGIQDAEKRALKMKADYDSIGYRNCAILTPDEVEALDPFLADFCSDHSYRDPLLGRIWNRDCVALWRPGGCLDSGVFIPKFYDYLKKAMGQYIDGEGKTQDCFQYHFNKEATGVEFASDPKGLRVAGLHFADGTSQVENLTESIVQYVFCPGEAVGTLHSLGFNEPDYAAFAGPSLLLSIPLRDDQIDQYRNFSHCMEVHKEGITLAWQARLRDRSIFIGVAGTKSFYGDKRPKIDEEFAKNRHSVQINMINDVLPEFISLAQGVDTRGKILSEDELSSLVDAAIARRWVGRRAVAYDGYPTLGSLYRGDLKVANARCTTHLGSGGVSFSPGAVFMSRLADQEIQDPFVEKILKYSDSRRTVH